MDTLHLLALQGIRWLGKPAPDGWRNPPAERQVEWLTVLAIATSLLLLLWLLARIQGRMTSPQPPRHPYRLLGRLLRRHGVGIVDRWLVLLMVIDQRVRPPAVLLLSPALFARHADAWLTRSKLASLWPGTRKRLLGVAQRIFTDEAGLAA